MSFVDEVNKIKDGVLSKPEYKVAIKSVIDRANQYTVENRPSKDLEEKEPKELTL